MDNDKKGFLTEQEFCSILKLIACAQHGAMAGDPILSTSGNVSAVWENDVDKHSKNQFILTSSLS